MRKYYTVIVKSIPFQCNKCNKTTRLLQTNISAQNCLKLRVFKLFPEVSSSASLPLDSILLVLMSRCFLTYSSMSRQLLDSAFALALRSSLLFTFSLKSSLICRVVISLQFLKDFNTIYSLSNIDILYDIITTLIFYKRRIR